MSTGRAAEIAGPAAPSIQRAAEPEKDAAEPDEDEEVQGLAIQRAAEDERIDDEEHLLL